MVEKFTIQKEIFKLDMHSKLVFGLIYQISFIKNPASLQSQVPSNVLWFFNKSLSEA